jgi:ribosomal protein S18 acetylase RimI-like enzyme
MAAQEIEISKVTINDVETLRSISIQTFTETFSEQNTESNMQSYFTANLSSQKLTKELNTKDSAFYLIKLSNQTIGYLKINSGNSQTEKHKNNSLEIERIYVSKEFHGKNIGQILLEKAITIAKEKLCNYVWLGVWEKNLRAISFYKKNGFKEFDKHIFKLGEDEQTDILMKLELN